MFDIKWIRENPAEFDERLARARAGGGVARARASSTRSGGGR